MPSRRSPLSLFLLLAATLAVTGFQKTGGRVTNPREELGFSLGDDYQLANYTRLSSYWQKLARESDRPAVESGRQVCLFHQRHRRHHSFIPRDAPRRCGRPGHAWGTKDGQDVMAGVDHVIKNYPVSASRVATIGHSYGGFMSNWLITQYPDRFAAAIPGAGISNWISDYGLADIARTKETEFYRTSWDPKAREIMIRQSPLNYAHRVKATTLFIHGEIDHRVPLEEGEQMYFALKKNGVPAKIIQYAGQSHGISGHWNQVHRMLNKRARLDTYLKGIP